MFKWLRKLMRPKASSQRVVIRSRYDAVSPTGINEIHFLQADELSAKQANDPEIRRKLRKYSRYETANNSYAKGMTLTVANEQVGRCPWLQLRTEDRKVNRQVKRMFADWMLECNLGEKLNTYAQTKVTDGEAFAILTTNPSLDHPVKLDVQLIDAERVATPDLYFDADPLAADGIRFDKHGNPVEYSVLKNHPGDFAPMGKDDIRKIPAKYMLHWFRADRPGQVRGVPEILPALGLYAQLRRWTLAVLVGAETAANFAAVLHTDAPPDGAEQNPPWDLVDVPMGTMTSLPAGWKMSQFTPQQPVSNYDQFKHEIIKEIARCLNMPANVAAGDSSFYNYASGRLDHQNWKRSIAVSLGSFERSSMDRIYWAWLNEASRIRLKSGRMYLPSLDLETLWWDWIYMGSIHVDPVKDATGDALALSNMTTTREAICAAQGRDWEEDMEQLAIERNRALELGLDANLPDWAMVMQKEIAESNDDVKPGRNRAAASYGEAWRN